MFGLMLDPSLCALIIKLTSTVSNTLESDFSFVVLCTNRRDVKSGKRRRRRRRE